MKQYMVIEHFAPGAKEKIYARFHEKRRMLPEGLHYLNSWLEKEGDRCFHLMETNDRSLFDPWVDRWKDLRSSSLAKNRRMKPNRVLTLDRSIITRIL